MILEYSIMFNYLSSMGSVNIMSIFLICTTNLLACVAEKAVGEVINIGCGERHTLLQLIDAINKILGKSIKPIFEEERVGDVKHSLASIEKAKKMLGFKVVSGFEEGLEKIIKDLL